MKEQDAYNMMFRFLEDRFQRLPSDDLGLLLGEMQLAVDGKPFDPAIEEEWNAAVASTVQAKRPLRIAEQRKAS